MKDRPEETIAVLDFGSQYTQLIARRIREAGVYCEIVPFFVSRDDLRRRGTKGIVFSGGPASVLDRNPPLPDAAILELGIPILGICYGMQVLARLLGGQVERGREREYGAARLRVLDHRGMFRRVPAARRVWMSHGDHLVSAPPGFRVIARTARVPIAAIADSSRSIYGVQFHPEVAHTPDGRTMLRNFLYSVCRCHGGWSIESFLSRSMPAIRRRVGGKGVVLGLSGGVDSAVTALLLYRAIRDRLTCIFVDNGLLREGERNQVEQTFRDSFGIPLRVVDAGERFLQALAGVTDPEAKRKVIGHQFIRVFQEEALRIGDVHFLAQGTLYPDVIESRSVRGPSATIKSHHNVGGLPVEMDLALIEPLRELFKDEVRALGSRLGLPERMVWRQPFPGPGLAVRIIGEVTPERLRVLRAADGIVVDEVERYDTTHRLWQFFAVLLPVRTVGVMGDGRTYEHVVALRVVESQDGMTADWPRIPRRVLARVSNRIINEVRGVNRVVLDISSKPPATIEWE